MTRRMYCCLFWRIYVKRVPPHREMHLSRHRFVWNKSCSWIKSASILSTLIAPTVTALPCSVRKLPNVLHPSWIHNPRSLTANTSINKSWCIFWRMSMAHPRKGKIDSESRLVSIILNLTLTASDHVSQHSWDWTITKSTLRPMPPMLL